ncbi:hypothetical protein KSP40_PGU013364 [Platanthera guangdongensis]|uniref:Uncharacterized protein n=1 Tax=Platanthera guangdongensis TaxID=2320717 RepID=A0ABR2N623_9ASPA
MRGEMIHTGRKESHSVQFQRAVKRMHVPSKIENSKYTWWLTCGTIRSKKGALRAFTVGTHGERRRHEPRATFNEPCIVYLARDATARSTLTDRNTLYYLLAFCVLFYACMTNWPMWSPPMYEIDDRLSPDHEKTIVERLLFYHPESQEKIGPGIDYIKSRASLPIQPDRSIHLSGQSQKYPNITKTHSVGYSNNRGVDFHYRRTKQWLYGFAQKMVTIVSSSDILEGEDLMREQCLLLSASPESNFILHWFYDIYSSLQADEENKKVKRVQWRRSPLLCEWKLSSMIKYPVGGKHLGRFCAW